MYTGKKSFVALTKLFVNLDKQAIIVEVAINIVTGTISVDEVAVQTATSTIKIVTTTIIVCSSKINKQLS